MKKYASLALKLALAIFGVLTSTNLQTVITDPHTLGFVMTAVGVIGTILHSLPDPAPAAAAK